MTGIIVALPRLEDAKNIKNLLVRNGFGVAAVCTSGSQVLVQADDLQAGVVICGYKLTDMLYAELYEDLPSGFGMLLLASGRYLAEGITEGIASLEMPFQLHELLRAAGAALADAEYQNRKRKEAPRVRNVREMELILEAKNLLAERKGMTEEEAHRYLQKTSMDNGKSMVETARMVLSLL